MNWTPCETCGCVDPDDCILLVYPTLPAYKRGVARAAAEMAKAPAQSSNRVPFRCQALVDDESCGGDHPTWKHDELALKGENE